MSHYQRSDPCETHFCNRSSVSYGYTLSRRVPAALFDSPSKESVRLNRSKRSAGARHSERANSVYGTVNVTDGYLTVHYDPLQDAIEIEGAEPGSTRTESYHPRDSGKPKIISSVPTFGPSPFTTTKALLLYDRVIAIDTNTRIVDGVRWGVAFLTTFQNP